MTTSNIQASSPAREDQFALTRWSMVLTAGQWPLGSAAQRAMNMLAQAYWFPLYAYLRRQGCDPTQAEDLVQGFFAHLLDKEALANVDQSKGRFRTFLLVSLKNYQRNVVDAQQAQKRGGGQRVLSLDTAKAEMRYAVEPVDAMTPDRMYEKQWALAVLDQVLEHLREDYETRQQLETFTALQHVLDGSAGQKSLPDLTGNRHRPTSTLRFHEGPQRSFRGIAGKVGRLPGTKNHASAPASKCSGSGWREVSQEGILIYGKSDDTQ